jgi:hypothetical protein
VSTFTLIEAAVASGDGAAAAELTRYTITEMAEPIAVFPPFHERAREFLAQHGVGAPEIEVAENELAARRPGVSTDLAASWESYVAVARRCATSLDSGSNEEALHELLSELDSWRPAHDLACDLVHLHFAICAERLGENLIGEMWDYLLGAFYSTRDKYDTFETPWEQSFKALLLDAFETFRGHLSGPDRRGDIEITDEPDRVKVTFAPCGSGGRGFLSGPDREPSFAVTATAHDWSWNKEGVCLYCVHCCQLQQRVPIKRFGYPVRVVEPPTWPEQGGTGRCTWYVYKDHSLVPDEAYEAVGETRPG